MRVLIVEDLPAVAEALSVLCALEGFEREVVATPQAAEQRAAGGGIGLVIQDMNFAPGETDGARGVELFRRLRKLDPTLPMILITAWSSLQTAIALVKEGAVDYFQKPWDDSKLIATLRTQMQLREWQLEAHRLRADREQRKRALLDAHDLRGMVFESETMLGLLATALQAARSDVPIFIGGESGVGKEKLADVIVANSRRKDKPFVKLNAGGVPLELLESELFGAEAGAYTGATRTRAGRFEAADGGTLFLDEISMLPMAGQVSLLRVLESGQFERLGSSQTRRVDVRLISATNANLATEIAAGRFREDLYFRINAFELIVPPLRERKEEILPLIRTLVPADHVLAPDALAALTEHDWPGNVRELLNRTRRALAVGGTQLTRESFGLRPDADDAPLPGDERGFIRAALARHNGNVSRAAEDLGLSRQSLYRRMERLGLGVEKRLRD